MGITLTQEGCTDKVTIEGTLTGLGAGSHGWHIHQFANLDMTAENPCAPAYTGGHFNPFQAPSGNYNDNRRNREVGQIGQINCDVDDNCVSEQDEDKLIKLKRSAQCSRPLNRHPPGPRVPRTIWIPHCLCRDRAQGVHRDVNCLLVLLAEKTDSDYTCTINYI